MITPGRGAGILQVRVIGREPAETGRAAKLLSNAYSKPPNSSNNDWLMVGIP